MCRCANASPQAPWHMCHEGLTSPRPGDSRKALAKKPSQDGFFFKKWETQLAGLRPIWLTLQAAGPKGGKGWDSASVSPLLRGEKSRTRDRSAP